jgi:competence protein ComEA
MKSEHRTILALLALAVAGQGARWLLSRPDDAPGALAPLGGIAGQAVRPHRDSSRAAGRPLAPGETIDADRAPAEELARLPRVGPGLARRIVADRDARGPFGSLAGLDRVPGIGAALLGEVGRYVTFSGVPRVPAGGEAGSAGAAGPTPLDLNSAPAEALQTLPGVAAARARAIEAWRARHGPFRGPDDLARVPGIGAKRAARIWALAGGAGP